MLTITAGTHTAARAGYTIAKNGSTKNNTLTITDGTVGAAYGGWTEGKNLIASTAVDETRPVAVNTGANAEAEGNKLSLSGGTIGANGKIAGGYIAKYTLHQSHLVSAGDAKTNKVNISGGTIGDNTAIYGGYTEGSGNATDNTLNVLGKDITVRGVENFGKTNFDLAHKTVGDTLLKITGGATNKMDWAGVEVVQTAYSFTPKSYDKHLFILMDNEDGINFMKGTTDTYATIGVKERTIGDYEFVIDTDNHTGHANRYVYADGFRFHDNADDSYTAADGTHNAAWSGRTAAPRQPQHAHRYGWVYYECLRCVRREPQARRLGPPAHDG